MTRKVYQSAQVSSYWVVQAPQFNTECHMPLYSYETRTQLLGVMTTMRWQ